MANTVPDFDIYPDLEEEIEEATEHQGDAAELAVDGLKEIVDNTIGNRRQDYEEAQARVDAIFKDFPDIRFTLGASRNDDYSTHRHISENIDSRKQELADRQADYDQLSWFGRMTDGKFYEKRRDRAAEDVMKTEQAYYEQLEESKKHIDLDHDEALLLQAMTEKYNQLVREMGEAYDIEVTELHPDQFLQALDYADIPSRDMEANGLDAKGSGRLDFVIGDAKKQIKVLALKTIFTAKGKLDEINGLQPLDDHRPRFELGGGPDWAMAEAESMNSNYALRVRTAYNGQLIQFNGMARQYYIPVDNFTAALIKSLDTHAHDYEAKKINDAAVLDLWIHYKFGYPSKSAYVAFDLIDFSAPEDENI